VQWLEPDPGADIRPGQDSGFTGLTESEDTIYAAVQSSQQGKVLAFNKRLEYLDTLPLHGPCDIHAISHHDGYLYYAATSESRVMRHEISSGRNEVVWECEHYIHLNDIKWIDGELYILSQSSQFEPAASRGLLYGLERRRVVIDKLQQPHTIFTDDGKLYLLNSMAGECLVRHEDGSDFDVLASFPGYTRGMARQGDHFYIGLSASRLFSRKQGVGKLYFQDQGDYYGQPRHQCYIAQVDGASGETRLHNYSAYNFEIYDILPLSQEPATLASADAAALKAQCLRLQAFRQQQKIAELKQPAAAEDAGPGAGAGSRLLERARSLLK
jgi:hypothetical protein